ncbi:MAG TPA: serine hydrolase [Pyrinomonadaceae bacterium]|nr:serine hydrolase [Pyrinomonadaceae bacterium]
MKRSFILQKGVVSSLLTLVLLVATSSAQVPAPVNQDVVARINEYMDAVVKLGKFNGSLLIARDGAVVVNKGYGMSNFELDVPNTPQTKFRIGSITKPFTAIAVMLLQQRGKLSVQDSICKYVADCPAGWQQITLHHLLSHTSGLAKHDKAGDYLKTAMMPMSVMQLIERFKNKPADFKPGEKFDYNNNGYILLGHVIEKASGQSYEAFLKDYIFVPLGMANTGYDSHEPIIKNRAAGYLRPDDRVGGSLMNAVYIDQSQSYSAGGLYSTTEDLLRLDQALLGDKLLSPKTQEAMFTPAIGEYGPAPNYGYGWFVNRQFNRRAIFHPGGVPGFTGMMTRFPDDKLVIIFLGNLENSQVIRASRDLSALIFGEKYEIPKERTSVKIDPKVLVAYVGEFEDRPGRITTILVENDTLMLKLAGQPVGVPLLAESDTQFFHPVQDIQVAFVKNANNEVVEMTLRLNGREFRAKKIK